MYSTKRFDGDVYKHLYHVFLDRMRKVRGEHATPKKQALIELQKRIAREGL